MNVKAFEIRDKGTFIPAVAVRMVPELIQHTEHTDSFHKAEHYLLRRSGYGIDPLVILCRMEASGVDRNATYDPYAWGGNGTRTLTVAHDHIQKNWDALNSGDVIDVEFILNETQKAKKSERFDTFPPTESSPAGEDQ